MKVHLLKPNTALVVLEPACGQNITMTVQNRSRLTRRVTCKNCVRTNIMQDLLDKEFSEATGRRDRRKSRVD